MEEKYYFEYRRANIKKTRFFGEDIARQMVDGKWYGDCPNLYMIRDFEGKDPPKRLNKQDLIALGATDEYGV